MANTTITTTMYLPPEGSYTVSVDPTSVDVEIYIDDSLVFPDVEPIEINGIQYSMTGTNLNILFINGKSNLSKVKIYIATAIGVLPYYYEFFMNIDYRFYVPEDYEWITTVSNGHASHDTGDVARGTGFPYYLDQSFPVNTDIFGKIFPLDSETFSIQDATTPVANVNITGYGLFQVTGNYYINVMSANLPNTNIQMEIEEQRNFLKYLPVNCELDAFSIDGISSTEGQLFDGWIDSENWMMNKNLEVIAPDTVGIYTVILFTTVGQFSFSITVIDSVASTQTYLIDVRLSPEKYLVVQLPTSSTLAEMKFNDAPVIPNEVSEYYGGVIEEGSVSYRYRLNMTNQLSNSLNGTRNTWSIKVDNGSSTVTYNLILSFDTKFYNPAPTYFTPIGYFGSLNTGTGNGDVTAFIGDSGESPVASGSAYDYYTSETTGSITISKKVFPEGSLNTDQVVTYASGIVMVHQPYAVNFINIPVSGTSQALILFNDGGYIDLKPYLPKTCQLITWEYNSQSAIPEQLQEIDDVFINKDLIMSSNNGGDVTANITLHTTIGDFDLSVSIATPSTRDLPTFNSTLYAEAGSYILAPDNGIGTFVSLTYNGATYTPLDIATPSNEGDLYWSGTISLGRVEVAVTAPLSFVIIGTNAKYNVSIKVLPNLQLPNITIEENASINIVQPIYIQPEYAIYYTSLSYTFTTGGVASVVIDTMNSTITITGQSVGTTDFNIDNNAIPSSPRVLCQINVIPETSSNTEIKGIVANINTLFQDSIWNYLVVAGAKRVLTVDISTSNSGPFTPANIPFSTYGGPQPAPPLQPNPVSPQYTLDEEGNLSLLICSETNYFLQIGYQTGVVVATPVVIPIYIISGVITKLFPVYNDTIANLPTPPSSALISPTFTAPSSNATIMFQGTTYNNTQTITYNSATIDLTSGTIDIGNEVSIPPFIVTDPSIPAPNSISYEIVLPPINLNDLFLVETGSSSAILPLDNHATYEFTDGNNPTLTALGAPFGINGITISSSPWVVEITATLGGNTYKFQANIFSGSTQSFGVLPIAGRTITPPDDITYFYINGQKKTGSYTITQGTGTIVIDTIAGTIVVTPNSETTMPTVVFQDSNNDWNMYGFVVLPNITMPSIIDVIYDSNNAFFTLPNGPTYSIPAGPPVDYPTITLVGDLVTFTAPPTSVNSPFNIEYLFGSDVVQSVQIVLLTGASVNKDIVNNGTRQISLLTAPSNPDYVIIGGTRYTPVNSGVSPFPVQYLGSIYAVEDGVLTITAGGVAVAPIIYSDGSELHQITFTVLPAHDFVDIAELTDYNTPFQVPLPVLKGVTYTAVSIGGTIITLVPASPPNPAEYALNVTTGSLNSFEISADYGGSTETFYVQFTANNGVVLNVVAGGSNSISQVNTSVVTNSTGTQQNTSSDPCSFTWQGTKITFTSSQITAQVPVGIIAVDPVTFYNGTTLYLLQIEIVPIPLLSPINVTTFNSSYVISTLPLIAVTEYLSGPNNGQELDDNGSNYILDVPTTAGDVNSGSFSYLYYGYTGTINFNITAGSVPLGLTDDLVFNLNQNVTFNVISDYTTNPNNATLIAISVNGDTAIPIPNVNNDTITGIQALSTDGSCHVDTSMVGVNSYDFTINIAGTADGSSSTLIFTLTITILSSTTIFDRFVAIVTNPTTTFNYTLSDPITSPTDWNFVSLTYDGNVTTNELISQPQGNIDLSSFPAVAFTPTTSATGIVGPFLIKSESDGNPVLYQYLSFIVLPVLSSNGITLTIECGGSTTGNIAQVAFGDTIYQEILLAGLLPSASPTPTLSPNTGPLDVDNNLDYTLSSTATSTTTTSYTLTFYYDGVTPAYVIDITVIEVFGPVFNGSNIDAPIGIKQTIDIISLLTQNSNLPITLLKAGYPSAVDVPAGGPYPPQVGMTPPPILFTWSATPNGIFNVTFTSEAEGNTYNFPIRVTEGYNEVIGTLTFNVYDPDIDDVISLVSTGAPVSYTPSSTIVSYSVNGTNYELATSSLEQGIISTTLSVDVATEITFTPNQAFKGSVPTIILHLTNKDSILLNITVIGAGDNTSITLDVASDIPYTANLLETFFTTAELASFTLNSITPTYVSLTVNGSVPSSGPDGFIITDPTFDPVKTSGTLEISTPTFTIIATENTSGVWQPISFTFDVDGVSKIIILVVNAKPSISTLTKIQNVPFNTIQTIDLNNFVLVSGVQFVSVIVGELNVGGVVTPAETDPQLLTYTDDFLSITEAGLLITKEVVAPLDPIVIAQYTLNLNDGTQTSTMDITINFYDPATSRFQVLEAVTGVVTDFQIELGVGETITKVGSIVPTNSSFPMGGGTMTINTTSGVGTWVGLISPSEPVVFTTSAQVINEVYLTIKVVKATSATTITHVASTYTGQLFTTTGEYEVTGFTIGVTDYNPNQLYSVDGVGSTLIINDDGSYTAHVGTNANVVVTVNYQTITNNTPDTLTLTLDNTPTIDDYVFQVGVPNTTNIPNDVGFSGYTVVNYFFQGNPYNIGFTYTYLTSTFSIDANGNLIFTSSVPQTGPPLVFLLSMTHPSEGILLIEVNISLPEPITPLTKTISIPTNIYTAISLELLFGTGFVPTKADYKQITNFPLPNIITLIEGAQNIGSLEVTSSELLITTKGVATTSSVLTLTQVNGTITTKHYLYIMIVYSPPQYINIVSVLTYPFSVLYSTGLASMNNLVYSPSNITPVSVGIPSEDLDGSSNNSYSMDNLGNITINFDGSPNDIIQVIGPDSSGETSLKVYLLDIYLNRNELVTNKYTMNSIGSYAFNPLLLPPLTYPNTSLFTLISATLNELIITNNTNITIQVHGDVSLSGFAVGLYDLVMKGTYNGDPLLVRTKIKII